MKNCTTYYDLLPELLLDPRNAPDALKTHVAECGHCREALDSLRATFALLDAWKAPEPSPYFDVRMAARLREERNAAPAGWLELLRARMKFLPTVQLRPLLAGVLATLIIIGGGAFAGIATQPVAPSAAVNDLRIMDHNDKALAQMDQLLQADNDTGANAGAPQEP